MPRKPIDYSKTSFYKIVCKDLNIKDCYIGHTSDFTMRKYEHKSVCNNPNSKQYNHNLYQTIRENGNWQNWDMVLIEMTPMTNNLEARKREREILEQHNATLNQILPERSKQEYYQTNKDVINEQNKQNYINNREQRLRNNKEYREKNKEYLNKKSNDYYHDHREEQCKKRKEYRQNNKEKIAEQKKQHYEQNKEHYQQYHKEYHQQHKEEKKEYDKIYRENNKDRKRENDKVYREKNRDKLLAKIECACGNTYAHKNKSRHERSNKHQEYLKAVAED